MSDIAISRAGNLGNFNEAHEKRLKQAADQFETLFINQLLKQNESIGGKEKGVFGESPAERNYQELFNTALSESAAGSLGVSDAILAQMQVRKSMQTGSEE